jgi:hypothetical protein
MTNTPPRKAGRRTCLACTARSRLPEHSDAREPCAYLLGAVEWRWKRRQVMSGKLCQLHQAILDEIEGIWLAQDLISLPKPPRRRVARAKTPHSP